jgi:transmembrane sensor
VITRIRNRLKRSAAEREARAWHVRLNGGAATSADRDAHRAWIRSDACNARAYRQIDDVCAAIDEAGQSFTPAELDRLLGEPSPRPAWDRSRVAFGAVCASLLAAIIVLAVAPERASVVYDTPVAQTGSHRLPDGSTIVLGAGSRIRVDYGWFERVATLERGEAFFDVAHESRAFQVKASAVEVTVHGTQFEVRLEDPRHARVRVAEGVVSVESPSRESRVELQRGQAVGATPDGLSSVQSVDPDRVAAWREGTLVYDDAPLQIVTADLTRYSGRRFVNDPEIAELRVTGVFRTTALDDALRSIETVLPVRVVAASKNVYVLLPRTDE